SSKTVSLQLDPPQTGSTSAVLTSLNCATASYSSAGTDSCAVTLSAAAPSGGISISVSSNNAAVAVPGGVTVPAGATSAAFSVTVGSVATTQSATITATA